MKTKNPFWKPKSKSAPQEGEKVRTREDVQADYNRACNEAGDLQYKLVTFSQRIDWLTKFRGALNEEMNRIEEADAIARAEARKAEEASAPKASSPEANPKLN